MRRVGPLLCALLLTSGPLLAGCAAPQEDPRFVRPTPYPEDIDAPPPGPVENPPDLIEPPDPVAPFTLFGRVTDLAGRPLPEAVVWVEGADLREPVNNAAAYLQGREATLQEADGLGEFAFTLQGGFYYLVAHAPGFYPQRTAPTPAAEAPTRVDIRLVPDEGLRIIAHRGASFYAPENTLASMHKAFLLGADRIEMDAQVTADGHVVIIHDPALERTTNGTGLVRDATLAHIRTLDAGGWFDPTFRGERVPTLADALAFARDHEARIIIDVKSAVDDATGAEQAERAVLEAVRDTGLNRTAVVSTFRPEGVAHCVAFRGPDCALISRGPGPGEEVVRNAHALGAVQLHLRHNLVDAAAVQAAQDLGVRLFVWTVNDPADWDRFLALGVDGILTDRPGFLLDHINQRALAG